jgi:hypothetical protein
MVQLTIHLRVPNYFIADLFLLFRISCRELQTAFANVRLRLNDTQIFVLMKLIKEFAVSAGSSPAPNSSSSSSANEQQSAVDTDNAVEGTDTAPAPAPLVLYQGKVSADWTSKYLVYLRVTWKSYLQQQQRGVAAAATNAAASEAQNPETGEDNTDIEREHVSKMLQLGSERASISGGTGHVLRWDEWVARKHADYKQKYNKSKEFRKALAGLSHALTKEKLDAMLEALDIIPPDMLADIIDTRVQTWRLNDNGRGDYQHQLNLEIKRFQTKLLKESGTPWHKCNPQQQKAYIATIVTNLCETKKKELFESEMMTCRITKELFAEYTKFCSQAAASKTATKVWGQWLQTYIDKGKERIQNLRKQSMQSRKAISETLARGHQMAALTDVEKQMKEAADSLHGFAALDIRKRLVKLRKTVAERGGSGHGQIVLKQDYDALLAPALQPVLRSLPAHIQSTAAADSAAGAGVGSGAGTAADGDNNLFFQTEDKATERVVKANSENVRIANEEIQEWTKKKIEARRKKVADEVCMKHLSRMSGDG